MVVSVLTKHLYHQLGMRLTLSLLVEMDTKPISPSMLNLLRLPSSPVKRCANCADDLIWLAKLAAWSTSVVTAVLPGLVAVYF